jgi:hypothetical protein
MKLRLHVLSLLFLGVSFAMETACTPAPPANTNQPNINTNAAPSNSSKTSPSQQSNQSTTGTIEVSSVPPGARVLLISNDESGAGEPQPKGLTPTTITGIQPGKYTVDLERPGYRFFQKEITVKKGATAKISATLKKQ